MSETRRCHVLTDEFGLRARDMRYWPKGSARAGFNAVAWKADGSDALERDLRVSYGGGALLTGKLKGKTAALVEVSWPPIPAKESWESPSVDLVEYVGPSNDPAFQSLEQSFQNPKAVYELALGRFTRDERVNWIEGDGLWLGKPVRLTIEAELEIDIPAEEALLAELLANAADWDAKARRAIIDGLYEIWRDNWRDEKPVVDEATFAAAMPIESITAYREGRFEMWFGDTDFFWGHSVSIRGTLKEGLKPAEMQG